MANVLPDDIRSITDLDMSDKVDTIYKYIQYMRERIEFWSTAEDKSVSDSFHKFNEEFETSIEQDEYHIKLHAARIGQAEADIEVNADNIELYVTGEDAGNWMISRINLTSTTAEIAAAHIRLEGFTSINGNFIVDVSGNFQAYGGNIGGWNINSTGLYYGTIGQPGGLLLDPSGTPSTAPISIAGSPSLSGWSILAGNGFGVTNLGAMYCNNAHISGVITAGQGSSIAGWNTTDEMFYKDSYVGNTATNQYRIALAAPLDPTGNSPAIYSASRYWDGTDYGSWSSPAFYLTYNGYLYSQAGGKLGVWNIGSGASGALYTDGKYVNGAIVANVNGAYIGADQIAYGAGVFSVSNTGALYCTDATIDVKQGSHIGGLYVSSDNDISYRYNSYELLKIYKERDAFDSRYWSWGMISLGRVVESTSTYLETISLNGRLGNIDCNTINGNYPITTGNLSTNINTLTDLSLRATTNIAGDTILTSGNYTSYTYAKDGTNITSNNYTSYTYSKDGTNITSNNYTDYTYSKDSDIDLVHSSSSAWWRVKVGNSSNNVSLRTHASASGDAGVWHDTDSGYSASKWLISIDTSGTVTTDTTSDRRLKDEVGTIEDREAMAVLSGVRPINYIYKGDKDKKIQNGIYAQDLRDILKEFGYRSYLLITKDGKYVTDLDTPEEEVTYGIDYSKLVTVLIKGWQMHEARIRELEAQIGG